MPYLTRSTLPLTIAARLARHGFMLTGTGGNRTAYVRTDRPVDPEIEESITVDGQATAPTRLEDRCLVYTRSLVPGDDGAYDGPVVTLEDVLNALEDPRDEYYLLELRLDNGYGRGGER